MRILRFDALDSTSSYATRLLDAEAEKPPFMVAARTQTAGRGRSGRSWMSPDGGLYLTLVLESKSLSALKAGELPLWAASQTARWLQQTFGIRVTIKWPNDILFGAHKLAGILCESRVQGSSWGPLCLGIGINLHDAPSVSEQASTSLDQILGRFEKRDSLDLAESLAQFLLASVARAEWLDDYQQFALEAGQIFKDSAGQVRELRGLNADGQLGLAVPGGVAVEWLSSVSHAYRWLPQLDEEQPLLLADIGNSLCKLAYFPDSRQPEARVLRLDIRDAGHADLLKSFLETIDLPRPWIVPSISVAQRPRDKFAQLLKEHGLYLSTVPKRPLRVDFSAYNFAQLGVDRVALSEAARHRFPGQPALVISAGTAITVEALSADGRYLGGYILNGLQSKLNSLHLRTDRLPLLKVWEETLPDDLPLFGQDTRSAMLLGIIHETAALVDSIRRRIGEAGAETQVIFTGGDGALLSRYIPGHFTRDLVLEGVRILHRGGTV